MRDLRRLFFNPPKGGNEVGVQTASSMAPLPGPMGSTTRPYGAFDGGASVQAQREAREIARMSPEARDAYYMRKCQEEELRKANPSGPMMQTSLRETFEKGELSSRTNSLQSGRVGQPEFRNYDRGRIPSQEADDPSALMAYDFKENLNGRTGVVGEVPGAGYERGPLYEKPMPSLRPNVHLSYRTDGKPNFTMGVPPNGNKTGPDSDGDNDYDDIDDQGGI